MNERGTFVHLEHVDPVDTGEDWGESGIADDVALVGWVLQVVLLDVGPNALDSFGTG